VECSKETKNYIFYDEKVVELSLALFISNKLILLIFTAWPSAMLFFCHELHEWHEFFNSLTRIVIATEARKHGIMDQYSNELIFSSVLPCLCGKSLLRSSNLFLVHW
jgi:hypothetical protein